ncbi:MAG: type II secretion system protein GspC [Pseudomonadota bacterium]|nr:type II secretion system protein GspC [Pseudomonadota bacterium]
MDLADKLKSLRLETPAFWSFIAKQHVPSWLNILFIIAITWYLVKIFWVFIPSDNIIPSNLIKATLPKEIIRSNINYDDISSAHLFGLPGAEKTQERPIDVPETQLSLELRGTITANDDSISHAIIAEKNGKDKLYFINDALPGGASLHQVYANRVILKRGAIFETLRLPKLSQGVSNLRQTNNQNKTNNSIPQSLQNNVASFTDVIRPQPFMPNGELMGYRIYPGRDRRKFATLGLRAGDLVTEINGMPLNNMQGDMETFRNLTTASQIVLTLERGNISMVVTIDPEQMSIMGQGQVK